MDFISQERQERNIEIHHCWLNVPKHCDLICYVAIYSIVAFMSYSLIAQVLQFGLWLVAKDAQRLIIHLRACL